MRAAPDEVEFAKVLKAVGEGTQPTLDGHPPTCFAIPSDWMNKDNTLESLIKEIFEDDPSETGKKRAILTQTNEDCRKVNFIVRDEYLTVAVA
jgi:hypothetical protein